MGPFRDAQNVCAVAKGGAVLNQILTIAVVNFLQQEIQSRTSERPPLGELIEIADEYKGLVMGKGGDNLRNISTQTGAKVVRKQGEVYIASGTEQQRQQAKVLIKIIIVSIHQYGIYFCCTLNM